MSKLSWQGDMATEYVRDLVWEGDVEQRTLARILVRFYINQVNVTETAAAWHAIAEAYSKASGEPPCRVITDGQYVTELQFAEVTARVEETHRPEADFKITFTGTLTLSGRRPYPVRTPAFFAQALRDLGQVMVAFRMPATPPEQGHWPKYWQLEFVARPIEGVLLLEYYTTNK